MKIGGLGISGVAAAAGAAASFRVVPLAAAAFVPGGAVRRGRTAATPPLLRLENLPGLSDLADATDKLSTKASELATSLPAPPRRVVRPPPSPPPRVPSPPPPFDPTDPEALISATKSFVATDFGVMGSQVPDYSTGPGRNKRRDDDDSAAAAATAPSSSVPFYGASLLSSNFVWCSVPSLDDGRTGLATKDEYLAAGRYFDLRGSFPDLEYRAHDFRIVNEGDDGEITVRFTTRAVGTFRGKPLRLRKTMWEPNGKVMRCPPTSVSVTYATRGEDRGRIVKLVTDAVLDRQVGNTDGLSGVPAAATIAGAPPDAWWGGIVPPLVSLGRFFARPTRPIDADGSGAGEGGLPPYPETVMIQLAKGVIASGMGLDDPNLLAEDFAYLEPLMGPLDKEKYLEVFLGYDVQGAVPDLDYGLENFRVDPYDPYRVWVDTRSKGTRTGTIGTTTLPPNVNSAAYEAPPEALSFTFDDDGFCTRFTAAAVLDPLLGNTGGLGGVYGLLYATGTPANALLTRSLNGFLSRASKSLLSGLTGVGPNGWKLSDGRVVNGLPSSGSLSLPAGEPSPPKSLPQSTVSPPAPKPFFAAEAEPKALPKRDQPRPTFALPKVEVQSPIKPSAPPAAAKELPPATVTKTIQIQQKEKSAPISSDPADPVTEALTSAFGISSSTGSSAAAPTKVVPSSSATESKAQQLRNAAAAARAEAAEAKKKAEAKKAKEAAEKQALLEDKKQAQLAAAEAKKQVEALKAKAAAEKNALLEAKKAAQLAAKEKMAAEAAEKQKMASKQPSKTPRSAVPKSGVGSTAKRVSTAQPPSSSAKGGRANAGFSFFTSSSSSVPKKVSSPPTEKASPAKSPTISLFDSLKPKSTEQVPEKPKKAATITNAVAKGTSVKRSPSISLFQKKSPTKKKSSEQTSKSTPKKTPTFNISGIGGMMSNQSKKKSVAPKSKSASPLQPAKGTAPKRVAAKPKSKSPSQPAKGTASKRSPTINIFSQRVKAKGKSPQSTTAASAKSAAVAKPKSRQTFSLFGGTTRKADPGAGSDKQKKTASVVTPTQPAAKPSPASSGGNSNPFGMFFGGDSSAGKGKVATDANNVGSRARNKPATPAKKSTSAPKGVPVLRQWKRVNGNAVEGRIFGSSSFKNGSTVTTSPINKGNLVKGNVVQTESGSKYFLE